MSLAGEESCIAMDVSTANQIGARELKAPASTVWPVVLAFGFTLLFAGLLTNVSISLLGAALAFCGSVGWLREVLPHEHEIIVVAERDDDVVTTSRRIVERFPLAETQVRAWLPIETYPVSAGLRGGLVGSVAMAAVACVFGLLHAGSVWYPINLLAAVLYSQSQSLSAGDLNAFHANRFLIATVLHLVGSGLVGLLYGAMLPMLPRRPILLGGLIAPLLWSGLLWAVMDLLNPLLSAHIDWSWFAASQVAFGVTAGVVVLRQSRVPTHENVPFAIRAGIESPGTMAPHERGEGPR
jgi:hypothetical protein